jgi:RNA polymerase sigma-70 factor (ECF subfamily)
LKEMVCASDKLLMKTMPEPSNELLETRLSLIARLKQLGDQESWREFVDTYGPLLYSVASRSGLTREEVEDAVQETLVSIAKTMPGYRYDPSVCSFKSWLRHLAQKRIADQFRKRPAIAAVAPQSPGVTSQTAPLERIPDPQTLDWDAVWEHEWQKQLFDSAVVAVKEQVSPEQFQIFDCYALKQWPVKQVTKLLGVSSTQVYLAKFRILGLIRKEVKRLERGRI